MTKFTLTNQLKKSAVTCAVLASLFNVPAMANEQLDTASLKQQQKTNENIGFGTGMVVGAIVAGPIGAIVSSVVGVLTANHINVANEKEMLKTQLDQQETSYQTALQKYQQKLQHAEQSYQADLLALRKEQQLASQLQAENLLMSLQFSTGSSELKAHYAPQIASLAKLLKQSPSISIDLSGYTDLQGSEALNHALSIARVNAVKNALITQGVEADRINLFAFGEQAPVVANNDNQVSFYDRRVVIKLHSNESEPLNQQTVSNY